MLKFNELLLMTIKLMMQHWWILLH